METISSDFFFQMIKDLRQKEEIILYRDILRFSEEEIDAVGAWLQEEYTQETMDYPKEAPPFHLESAIWAAQVVYLSAQLILYRQHKESELEELFPKDEWALDASTSLSVDLCLRFVPEMMIELQAIDPEDRLLEKLEQIMKKWAYSAIGRGLSVEKEAIDCLFSNACMRQLYTDRIVEKQDHRLAQNEEILKWVKGDLGMYAEEYWNNFLLKLTHEQDRETE